MTDPKPHLYLLPAPDPEIPADEPAKAEALSEMGEMERELAAVHMRHVEAMKVILEGLGLRK